MERRTRSANREQWRRRVQRWRDSGLTAAAFAAQMGLNVHSLRRWKSLLDRQGREASGGSVSPAPGAAKPLPLIEIRPGAGLPQERFEVELGPGRLLRIPPTFETRALRRLLAVLREGA